MKSVLTYHGQWKFGRSSLREFKLILPDGQQANFSVRAGESIKQKLAQLESRFNHSGLVKVSD
jgi:hypothetical protein